MYSVLVFFNYTYNSIYILFFSNSRVKSMLARNNCASIFWMGNLKHRDIKGAEVSSQLENSQLEVDGDDDDLLPDEVRIY